MERAAPRPAWRALDAAVQVLAPTGSAPSFAEFLEASLDDAREPFEDGRCAAIGELSAAFLKDPVLKADAASVAVGFWMRPASIARYRAAFERKRDAEPNVVRAAAGRVFHVAPSNVDTLFIYSWALSYLCGNANVVRVSRERPPVVEAMLRVIDNLSSRNPDLRDRNRFVTYEHDAEVTTALSLWCSHRILWGGDETIAALRPLGLNPHASERVFGSKFSYAVLAAASYLAADEKERRRLAGGFFNDLFWFDQMACSSPQIVFWVGDEASCERAATEFEEGLQAEVERRAYTANASNAVRRLSFAFDLAATGDVRVHLEHPGFVGVRVRDARGLDKQTCGGGLIRHARLDSLAALATFASEADQTVIHYGFAAEELRALAKIIGARGVDRIVPIGEALAFDAVWDGFDLLDDLTRRVTVRDH